MRASVNDRQGCGPRVGFQGFLISLALGLSACAVDASGDETSPDQGDLSNEELIAEGTVAVSEAALSASDFTNFKGVSAIEVRSDAFVLNDTTDRQGIGVLLPPIGGFSNNSTQLPNVQFYFFPNQSGAVALTSDIESAVAPLRTRLDSIAGQIESAVAPVRSTLTNLIGDVDVALQQNVDQNGVINGLSATLGAVNNEVVRLRNDVNNLSARINSTPPPPSSSCSANDGQTQFGGTCAALQCGDRCREAGRGNCMVSAGGMTCTAKTVLFGPNAMPCPGLCCLCN